MATRIYKSGDPHGVPSGYNSKDIPNDIVIPSCGIEDVDTALFNLFNEEIGFSVRDNKSGNAKNIPVIFASGERWALVKRKLPLRDKSNSIILPLTTIRRLTVEQDTAADIAGRGMNQQTGEIVVKRRLAPNDPVYQNYINKLGIKNQVNIPNSLDGSGLETDREQGELANDSVVRDGGYLATQYDNGNIWEVITIPAPQFYHASYEITFWTQYTTHMNQLIEQLMSAYLPQGNCFKITTPKGYWFVAKVEANEFKNEDNSEDYGKDERIIRYSFTVTVPAYIIVGDELMGFPAATRKYVSAPIVSFQIGSDEGEISVNGIPDDSAERRFEGSDDPTNPFTLNPIESQEYPRKEVVSNYTTKYVPNPFSSGKSVSYLRTVAVNKSSGETIYRDIDGLTYQIEDE